jgi:alkylhydroperoxidase family enzyme
MTWLPQQAPGTTPFARVFGLCPELHADWAAFAELFRTQRAGEPALLELCRVRIAQIVGCDATAHPDCAEKIAALDDWRRSTAFSAVERACLALAEKFVLDPRGVSDADCAAVTAHLSPAETVALVEALALFDGFARFRAILAIESGGRRAVAAGGWCGVSQVRGEPRTLRSASRWLRALIRLACRRT